MATIWEDLVRGMIRMTTILVALVLLWTIVIVILFLIIAGFFR